MRRERLSPPATWWPQHGRFGPQSKRPRPAPSCDQLSRRHLVESSRRWARTVPGAVSTTANSLPKPPPGSRPTRTCAPRARSGRIRTSKSAVEPANQLGRRVCRSLARDRASVFVPPKRKVSLTTAGNAHRQAPALASVVFLGRRRRFGLRVGFHPLPPLAPLTIMLFHLTPALAPAFTSALLSFPLQECHGRSFHADDDRCQGGSDGSRS